MLLASAIAGLLWDQLGASFTFYAGAGFCAIALAALAWLCIDSKPARSC